MTNKLYITLYFDFVLSFCVESIHIDIILYHFVFGIFFSTLIFSLKTCLWRSLYLYIIQFDESSVVKMTLTLAMFDDIININETFLSFIITTCIMDSWFIFIYKMYLIQFDLEHRFVSRINNILTLARVTCRHSLIYCKKNILTLLIFSYELILIFMECFLAGRTFLCLWRVYLESLRIVFLCMCFVFVESYLLV